MGLNRGRRREGPAAAAVLLVFHLAYDVLLAPVHGRRQRRSPLYTRSPAPLGACLRLGGCRAVRYQFLAIFSAKCRSFSAVSKRNFASKYAFDSIFQNLPDYLADIFEIWQTFAKFATSAKILLNFHEKC